MQKFTHLHTHSHYSLLDGLAKIDELVGRAKELGMDSLALTDHGNLYGAIEFLKKAKAAGIKPILGVEAYVAPISRFDKNSDAKYYHLILLCKNLTGWKNLIQLVTKAHLEGFYYKPRVDKELLKQHSDGLIALSACLSGEIPRLLSNKKYEEAKKTAMEYQEIFGKGNFFLEIGHHPGIPETLKIRDGIIKLSRETSIELAATQDIHYLNPEDAEYHDILLAIQTGNKLTDSDRLTLKNDDFSMRSPEQMYEIFKDIPEAAANTAKIAEQCNLELVLDKIQLPKFPLPEGKNAPDYLKELISEKMPIRYQNITPEINERLAYEFGVIEKTGFADYFLIVQDFINWAKDRGIIVGPGRGSAAGSLVSYVLGITDIDPIKFNLIFERFLNPDRIQMPDIDIDITDERRDEVFGYIREKYGENCVAHIITFGTMAARAAIRDVGRATGLNYGFCDQVAKLIPFNMDLKAALENVTELSDLYKNNPDAKKLLDRAKRLEGVARHASVHACGTVISQNPLTDYLPLQRAPQDENIIVTQFEMHSVENLGLLKIDLLGLKNLTIIEKTIKLVNEIHGEQIDISNLPEKDKKTFSLLQRGDTTGVFQLESSGMRRYLKELRPTELEDIIAMVALYRPGPMELIPEYIARKYGKSPVVYLHEKLEPVLKNTYGIMIYQEQLMTAARTLASFSLSEADVLRKAVGKKIRALLLQQKEKLINGCVANGISKEIAEKFWDLVEPFDRYGFNRSHAACYATIAYRTAYLKAHYPIEFMTSLLNADANDIDRISFLVGECKKMSIEVLPPDINRSSAAFTPENNNIRFGLTAVKNVGENIIQSIIENRQKNGPFEDLTSFLGRIQHKDLNKKSLESLIRCGALDSLKIERNRALQNIEEILKFNSALKRQQQSSQIGLFNNVFTKNSLRLKEASPATSSEKLAWEKELLGLYVSDHPLNSYRQKIEAANAKPIKELSKSGCQVVAGIISKVQKIITKTGKPMLFTRLEDFNDNVEVIVFPDTFNKNQSIWKENSAVLVSGRLSTRDGESKLICENVQEL